MTQRLSCFPPIIDRRSRVLILGTMPGPVALKMEEYYGNPQNLFWRLLAGALGEETPKSYPEKLRMLRARRIALWDTLSACVRPGALDASIRDEALNDIPGLLERYPGIRAAFANSRDAEAFLCRHDPARVRVPTFYLPSSSPANASLSFEDKLRCWSAIGAWL